MLHRAGNTRMALDIRAIENGTSEAFTKKESRGRKIKKKRVERWPG